MRGPNHWANQQRRRSGAARSFTPVTVPYIPPGQILAIELDALTHHSFSVINNLYQLSHRQQLRQQLQSAFYKSVNPQQHEWLVDKPRSIVGLMRLLNVLATQDKLDQVVMVESRLGRSVRSTCIDTEQAPQDFAREVVKAADHLKNFGTSTHPDHQRFFLAPRLIKLNANRGDFWWMRSRESEATIHGRCFVDFKTKTMIRPDYWFGGRPESKADKNIALGFLEGGQEAYALAVPILNRPQSGLKGETFIKVNFVVMPDTLYLETLSDQLKQCFNHRLPSKKVSFVAAPTPQQEPLFH